MINEDDVEKLASAAGVLAPSTSVYLEEDFVMNLLETVLDYMLQTEVVVRALEHVRENRWNEVRKLDDLEQLMARFPEDQMEHGARAAPVGLQLLDASAAATRASALLPQDRGRRPRAAQAVGAYEHVQERLRRPSQRARTRRLPMAGDAARRRHR
jgi:hypothetical protein